VVVVVMREKNKKEGSGRSDKWQKRG